ncbi:hypothetical protein, partial [Staphylococcus epidermidis]|uniref:hypothetical protein n=1 Tax=Staphylococcus epidermidis TaxID=1282 RepID=UPI00311D835A
QIALENLLLTQSIINLKINIMKKINPQLKRGLFLLVSFLYSTYAYSQSGTGAESNDASKYIPKIFPSSTEAFKFSNYGNIP